MAKPTRRDDERLLTMLDLRHGEGLGGSAIAERMGISRSAAVGAMARVARAECRDCTCAKPENRDGGMARRWWAR